MALVPKEYDEQKKLVLWMKSQHIIFTAISNDAPLSFADRRAAIVTSLKQKATGKQRGFPDMIVMKKNTIPLFLELKRVKKSRLSPYQEYWQKLLTAMGYPVHVAYGFEEAKKLINEYMAFYPAYN